jgi:formate dehydrogenase gamma subunit
MAENTYFIRFRLSQRIEHFTVMGLFTLLVLTGLPQKYPDTAWAQWIVLTIGGIDITRLIHRISGIMFAASAIYHFSNVSYLVLVRKVKPAMIFTLRDVRDAMMTLRSSLGTSREHPQYDRYDYRQKFEYWGLIFGGTIMILTGAVLLFPIQTAYLLPGQFIAAAKEVHSWEAMLALLTIVIWHLYGAHFAPEKFPADTSIFTGKISRERMLKEHPLEYASIMGYPDEGAPTKTEPPVNTQH